MADSVSGRFDNIDAFISAVLSAVVSIELVVSPTDSYNSFSCSSVTSSNLNFVVYCCMAFLASSSNSNLTISLSFSSFAT